MFVSDFTSYVSPVDLYVCNPPLAHVTMAKSIAHCCDAFVGKAYARRKKKSASASG